MIVDRPTTNSPWPVVQSLAGFDGKKLIMSTWFLAGCGIAALGSGVFVSAAIGDDSASWAQDGWTAHVGFLLLAIFSMLAVNTAGLRDRRSRTADQHEALPVNGATRFAGLLGATAWPAVVSTSLLAVVIAFAAVKFGVPIGRTAVQLIHNGMLVMMLGALGLALAAWLPNTFVAPVVAFALYTIHPGEAPAAWHAIWPFADIGITGLAVWHVLYLAGLTLVLATISQMRWGARRSQVTSMLVGCLVVAISLSVIIGQVCPSGQVCPV